MKVGLTQRVDFKEDISEYRDALDQRWIIFLESIGMTPILIPNQLKNIDQWLGSMQCQAYILTGGNDLDGLENAINVSPERDKTELAILEYAKKTNLPVLGVCRGFQFMNIFFGGKLERISGHVAQSHLIRTRSHRSENFHSRIVNSYHDWGISKKNLAPGLTPWAYDEQDNIEAAIHEEINWLGIMWHPEREDEFDNFDIDLILRLFNKELV